MRITVMLVAATLIITAPNARAAEKGAQVRVEFDARGITAVAAQGQADVGRAVSADDPVRVASISKLVVALGVMRMVEAGTLDLDADVATYLGWTLRHPGFPDRSITLRLLLSHRSALTDRVDYVIPLGGSLKDTVAHPKAWDEAHPPGPFFRYTNLNFPVIASVMESVSGERFDRLMDRMVIKPLKLDACFNWDSCSDATAARAVVLRAPDGSVRRDDNRGARPACTVTPDAQGGCDLSAYRPGSNGALFSPQGGLRISAKGLARIGRLLLNQGEDFLKPASIALIEQPVWRFDGANGITGESEPGSICAYGLAVQTTAIPADGCKDDPFGDGRPRIGHSGDAYGLRSGLWIDRAHGTGIAYYITAVPDDARRGRSAFTAAEERIIRKAP